MDYKEFRNIQENPKSFFEDYIMKPFLYGITFGVGYYLAVLVIEHPWSVSLLDFAKVQALKKAGKGLKGLKEATSTAEQTSGIAQVVVKEIAES